ncbi:YopX family protein [Rhodococcus qingshengii]|uniref:YopX family protein n=1 Tax=Rhodococcus qingshengii TaxID=334542 RepID=UPI001C6074E8|nr:YopX family protein [Rhodococcus qingshengii]MBW4818756.1 YopX family protein [Rhodococcus qingshengii]
MSREIKFRQWYDGKMRYLGHVNTGVGQLGFSDEYWIDLSDEHEQCDIMQFTGLLDKSGVEIYEGDILQSGRALTRRRVVTFSQAQFILEGSMLSLSGEIGTNENIEVIGNIYEHPGLLETSA